MQVLHCSLQLENNEILAKVQKGLSLLSGLFRTWSFNERIKNSTFSGGNPRGEEPVNGKQISFR